MISLLFVIFLQVPQKEIMYITVEDDRESKMIQSELTRDWRKPNPNIQFDEQTLEQIQKRGEELNKLRDSLNLEFRFLDPVHTPLHIKPLSYRFHRTEWEEIDHRAFLTTTFPLKTVCYLYRLKNEHKEIDRIESLNASAYEQYSQEYNAWVERLLSRVQQKYPKITSIHVTQKSAGLQGYDKDRGEWVILLDEQNYDFKKELAIKRDKKYIKYFVVYSGIERIIYYEHDDEGEQEVDLSIVDSLPPPHPRPLIHNKAIPPWKENR